MHKLTLPIVVLAAACSNAGKSDETGTDQVTDGVDTTDTEETDGSSDEGSGT